MRFFSVALLAVAAAQIVVGYPHPTCPHPAAPCHQPVQQVAPCQQPVAVPAPVNAHHHFHQPVQHHLPVFVVEDPSHEVLLLEEPARELVVIDTNDEPSALERILRILRKTGCAVRRVGDILAQDAGDELGLDDYGYGNAQAVAHTVINLGHPFIPGGDEEVIVLEPPCDDAVIVQAPDAIPIRVQQPGAVVQQPCSNQVHLVSHHQPQAVPVPVVNQAPVNHVVQQQPVHHVHQVQPVQQVQHVQHVQPVQQVQQVQPTHHLQQVQQIQPVHHVQQVQQVQQPVQRVQQVHQMQPVFVESPCDDEVAFFRPSLPVPAKYTYANKY